MRRIVGGTRGPWDREAMSNRFGGVACVLAWLVACAGEDTTPGDARVDASAATCTCCTRLPFTAAEALDVATDGTTAYVTFRSSGSAQPQLGTVSGAGGAPTPVAAADEIVLAASGDTVFYALGTGTSYELHQRTGAADEVLGAVSSTLPVRLAANAGDLYVFASDLDPAGTSTLWRFARSGGGGVPVVVATVDATRSSLALGATWAAISTNSGAWLVSIPGPSTPDRIETSPEVFVGAEGFVVRQEPGGTSQTSQWSIRRVVPSPATIKLSSLLTYGRYGHLRADANRLYYRSTSAPPGQSRLDVLLAIAPDGTGDVALCAAWPSDVLHVGDTSLLGLEHAGDEQWSVDVLAKP